MFNVCIGQPRFQLCGQCVRCRSFIRPIRALCVQVLMPNTIQPHETELLGSRGATPLDALPDKP